MKKIIRSIIILLNLLAVISLLTSYLSVYISPDKFWIPSFFGLAYPYILLGNILFVLYWLFSSSKFALISIITILLGYHHLQNYFQITASTTNEKGIVICSYNIRSFQGIPEKNVNATKNAKAIFSYLKSRKPNIVCLQEFSHMGIKGDLKNFMSYYHISDQMHLQYGYAQNAGPAIFSSYPILNGGQIRFPHTSNMITYADLKIGKDTVRLFNCHLESYRFSSKEIDSLDSLSIQDQSQNIREARLFGSKLKRALKKRAIHAQTLREKINASPYPVIICGDFNDTPVSYTYHTIRGDDILDAFIESGQGIGNTYLGKLPSFRIDYILHSKQFKGYNFTINKVTFSDHYPVECKLIQVNPE